MTRLRFKRPDERDPYQYDVERIVRIFKDRGYDLSYDDARAAWEDFSDSMAAGWMMLDDDDSAVFATLRYRLDEDDSDDDSRDDDT